MFFSHIVFLKIIVNIQHVYVYKQRAYYLTIMKNKLQKLDYQGNLSYIMSRKILFFCQTKILFLSYVSPSKIL